MFLLIAEFFGAQIVLIAVIILVLKKTLNQQLVESAVRQLETLNPAEIDKDIIEITAVAYSPLNDHFQERISNAATSKIHHAINLKVMIDKKIKGGLILKFKDQIIDHSLVSRLKEGGLLR